MHKSVALAAIALSASLLVAGCSNAQGPSMTPAAFSPSNAAAPVADAFPKNTIGEEEPSEGIGTKNDPTWGTVGGFTQSGKAQVITFGVNSTITIKNISKGLPHTLNYVATRKKPPANFPSNVNLSSSASGNGIFGPGYGSGTLSPGHSVKVKLAKPGNYLIGCAFHYFSGMQGVLIVKKAAPVRNVALTW